MTCAEVTPLIGAYYDGELDAARASAIDAHVASCQSCAGDLETLRQVSAELRHAPYYRAPDALVRRVAPARPRASLANRWGWLAAAAAVVLTTATALVLWQRPGAETLTADAVVGSHVRSLMAQHLVDVESTDRHTVKPWFAGRVEFSPIVVDLASDGFPLTGGRLDYVQDHPAAALVYHRREHAINVFVWPESGERPRSDRDDSRGYHLVTWTHGGMTYWVISDLARPELDDFASKLNAAVAGS